LPIILYGFQLWYYKGVSLFYSFKALKIATKSGIIDYGCILYFISWRVEAIASLIPIYYHLNKISRRHHLRIASLSKHYIINSLLDNYHLKKSKLHYLAISYLIDKQHSKVKSSIADTNNCLNEVFSAFDKLHKELSSGFLLVDTFPDHISFHTVNYKDNKIKNAHL